jgi:hypothetical protein
MTALARTDAAATAPAGRPCNRLKSKYAGTIARSTNV